MANIGIVYVADAVRSVTLLINIRSARFQNGVWWGSGYRSIEYGTIIMISAPLHRLAPPV